MNDKAKTARALLSREQCLIGFMKCNGEQMAQRASSAKVFVVEPSPISDPAKISAVAAPRPVRESD
jgi:hypothetical protein